MSHQPERTEKDCLNCGAMIHGRYCHVCGQENAVTKQNAFSLVKHFIYDIFHFDGKFFDTVRYLLLKPGKVPLEYTSGRRAKYLDPIRMYLFTSAIFFLLFFSLDIQYTEVTDGLRGRLSKVERAEVAMELNARLRNGRADSFYAKAINLLLDSTQVVSAQPADSSVHDSVIKYKGENYILTGKFDSSKLIAKKHTIRSWQDQRAFESTNSIYESNDSVEHRKALLNSLTHRMPYMLFISLPFFALILKLLYARRKNFYYSDHLIFTLYHYIFTFTLLLLFFGAAKLNYLLGWGLKNWILVALILSGEFYLYKGMQKFYGQGRVKTLGKFLILNLLAFLTMIILITAFMLVNLFNLMHESKQ